MTQDYRYALTLLSAVFTMCMFFQIFGRWTIFLPYIVSYAYEKPKEVDAVIASISLVVGLGAGAFVWWLTS